MKPIFLNMLYSEFNFNFSPLASQVIDGPKSPGSVNAPSPVPLYAAPQHIVDVSTSVNGLDGFQINRGFTYGSYGSLGDVNADGIDDFFVANGFANSLKGQVYIVFGVDTAVNGAFPTTFDVATLDGTNGFIIEG